MVSTKNNSNADPKLHWDVDSRAACGATSGMGTMSDKGVTCPECKALQAPNTIKGENTMTTATTIPSNVPSNARIVSLTVSATYDKPRKCGGCEKKRKVNLIEIGMAEGKQATHVYTQQTCADCYDALKVQVGRHPAQPTRMEREIAEILSQQADADRDAAYTTEVGGMDDVERFLSPANPDCIPVARDANTWICACGHVNPDELQIDNPVVACLECDKARPACYICGALNPTGSYFQGGIGLLPACLDGCAEELLPTPTPPTNPTVISGIMELLAGTTTVEQVMEDVNAIITPQRYGLVGEADAIIAPIPAITKQAIGPEPGEALPKTFTEVIRQRIATQKDAGATVAELAVAWGRTTASIKKIVARLAND